MLKSLSFAGSTGTSEEYLEFQPDVYFYQADVPDLDGTRTYVSAELDDAYADGTIELSYIYSDGRSNSFQATRFPIEFSPKIGTGRLETLTVTAVSRDGQQRQDYVIQVRTRSYLKDLQVVDEHENQLTLSQKGFQANGFHFSRQNYMVCIPEGMKDVTVRATAYSTTAQMELDGAVFLGSAKLPADGEKHVLRVWQEDGDAVTEYTLQTQVVRTMILTAQIDGKTLPDGIRVAEFGFYDELGEEMPESYRKTTAFGVNGSHVFELPDGNHKLSPCRNFRPEGTVKHSVLPQQISNIFAQKTVLLRQIGSQCARQKHGLQPAVFCFGLVRVPAQFPGNDVV